MKTQITEFNFEKSSYEKLCPPPSSSNPGSNPRASGYGSEWWVAAAAVMVVFGVERWLWLSGTCGGMVVVSAKTTRLLWMTKFTLAFIFRCMKHEKMSAKTCCPLKLTKHSLSV